MQKRMRSRNWLRILLLPGLIALGVTAFFQFHLQHYLTFDALAANRAWLLTEIARNPVAAVLAFAAVYVTATTLSLPGSSFLTMGAGFLFGSVFGSGIVVIAATIGATLLFLIARTSFGELFRDRAEGALKTLKAGFGKDVFNYLLFLRLVPLFPFWLINLVSAFLDVPLRVFVGGTFLGIIPGTAVYASVGGGLGSILDQGGKPDLAIIFSPEILIPILALAVLALVPIGYRRLRRNRKE